MVVVGAGEGGGGRRMLKGNETYSVNNHPLFIRFCELEQYPGAIRLCVITLQTSEGKGTCESNLQTNNLKRKKLALLKAHTKS